MNNLNELKTYEEKVLEVINKMNTRHIIIACKVLKEIRDIDGDLIKTENNTKITKEISEEQFAISNVIVNLMLLTVYKIMFGK